MNEDHALSKTNKITSVWNSQCNKTEVEYNKLTWESNKNTSFCVMRLLNGQRVCKQKSCSIFISVESVKNDSDVKPKAAGLKVLFAWVVIENKLE